MSADIFEDSVVVLAKLHLNTMIPSVEKRLLPSYEPWRELRQFRLFNNSLTTTFDDNFKITTLLGVSQQNVHMVA